MLPELPDDLKEAQQLGISLFAGEAEEGRLDKVLKDAFAGNLKPLYNFMADLPDMSNQPMPILPEHHVRRTAGTMSSFDLGRGCPYQCSFCTIINVQGRKSRFRSADDLEAVIRENYAQNIKRFFITDDNFARNRNWEELFDRLISCARTKASTSNSPSRWTRSATKSRTSSRRPDAPAWRACSSGSRISIPTACSARRSGRTASPIIALCCRPGSELGIITYAGYILGFPNDTQGNHQARYRDHQARAAG